MGYFDAKAREEWARVGGRPDADLTAIAEWARTHRDDGLNQGIVVDEDAHILARFVHTGGWVTADYVTDIYDVRLDPERFLIQDKELGFAMARMRYVLNAPVVALRISRLAFGQAPKD